VIFSYPAWRQRAGIEHAEPLLLGGKLLEPLGGAVRRLIVHHQNLLDFRLCGKRMNRARDRAFLVSHGKNYRYGVAGIHLHGSGALGRRPGPRRATNAGLAQGRPEELLYALERIA
jgi:hypothetical protein